VQRPADNAYVFGFKGKEAGEKKWGVACEVLDQGGGGWHVRLGGWVWRQELKLRLGLR
jgi:hypothetical protein